ncbi:DUF4236 domain-containing protein [Pseudonocardia sp. NPDC049154]|uniref:DUF4236 domain-containing protein n=1 Tax=Pseudonocardia sp. NPDC049154 TaxID=3155501 RepID=UPI0033C3F5EF
MKFYARKRFTFGPLYATVTQSGRWSWGIKIGPFSHNFTSRTSSIDTPGPGGFRHQHGRKNR